MKALRFVLFAIACIVVAGLWTRWLHPEWDLARIFESPSLASRPLATRAAPAVADARAAVLSRLADAPSYAPFFDRLRSAFPSDYLSLVDTASQAVREGGHLPNPDRMMTDAMRRLRQTRGVLAAQAEAGALDNMFAAQGAVLDVLASGNAGLCVDFLYGGSSPEFMAFAATHREIVERMAVANLEAVVSGTASHVDRGQPDPASFDDLAHDLGTRGFSENEIAAVLDGKTFDPPLPDARLCEAGLAYLHAVAALPEDARLKIYALSATLLARS